jgi:hypothetical protein
MTTLWEIDGFNIYEIHALHNHFSKHIILNKEEEFVKMVVNNGL